MRERALREHGMVGAGHRDGHVLVEALKPATSRPARAAILLLGLEALRILGPNVTVEELVAPATIGLLF